MRAERVNAMITPPSGMAAVDGNASLASHGVRASAMSTTLERSKAPLTLASPIADAVCPRGTHL
jgi:hypothetical protein